MCSWVDMYIHSVYYIHVCVHISVYVHLVPVCTRMCSCLYVSMHGRVYAHILCVSMYVNAGCACPCTVPSEVACLGFGFKSDLKYKNSLAKATGNFPQDVLNWKKGISGFALWEKSQHQASGQERKSQVHM